MRDAAETLDLRPNPAILLGAGGALALVSAAFLPWPFAIASTVLGALMIAGADVDARTFLLPDAVTFGATVAGIMAAPLLDPTDPWLAGGSAVARAFGCAAVLALLRSSYARIRQREGLGFGESSSQRLLVHGCRSMSYRCASRSRRVRRSSAS